MPPVLENCMQRIIWVEISNKCLCTVGPRMCRICILPLYFRSWGYVSHQVAVTPCCPQCLSFCSNKRADSVHYPFFVCVSVLKCEGFVNAPILLWQGFYLTDTSRRHSLFLVIPVFTPAQQWPAVFIFSQYCCFDIVTWARKTFSLFPSSLLHVP